MRTPPLLLDETFPLPLDRPFTTAQAERQGLRTDQLSRWVRRGYLRRLLKGVYVATQVADTLDLRAQALALVVPPEAVVTDRTAGWLLGAPMILAPNDHLAVPPVSIFMNSPGLRLRNGLCASGERRLAPRDVVTLHGVRTTTALRTACDLGRLLHRDQALAAMDSLLRLGPFGHRELLTESVRFRGYRGVVQLRALAPLADGRAESPGESVMRLRWIDAGLPRPEPQVAVAAPHGRYYLDLGLEELRFGAEYFGEDYHGESERQADQARLDWLVDRRAFTIVVLRKPNLFGARRDAERRLVEGFDSARRALGVRSPWILDLGTR